MALVMYGGGVASMSGKLGGTVAARNRAGNYFRNWAQPTNAPTASQTQCRVNFAAISAAWSALAPINREAWNDYANGLSLLNRQGESYTPTGRQMFMSLNTNAAFATGGLLSTPPVGMTPPTITSATRLEVHVDAGTYGSMDIFDMDTVADNFVMVFGAPEQNTGKNNLATLYRLIGLHPYSGSANILADYQAIFGNIGTEGALMKVKLRVVDKLTGLSSPWLIVEEFNMGP